MKQKKIIRGISLFILLLIYKNVEAQIDIKFKYHIINQDNKEFCSINITYINQSSKSKLIWLNNWGVWLITDSTKKIGATPFVSKWNNSLFIKPDDLILSQVLTHQEYTLNHVIVRYQDLKLIEPDEMFEIELLIDDQKTINFIKQNKISFTLWTNEADIDSLDFFINQDQNIFYDKKHLTLTNLPISYQDDYKMFKFFFAPDKFIRLNIEKMESKFIKTQFSGE